MVASFYLIVAILQLVTAQKSCKKGAKKDCYHCLTTSESIASDSLCWNLFSCGEGKVVKEPKNPKYCKKHPRKYKLCKCPFKNDLTELKSKPTKKKTKSKAKKAKKPNQVYVAPSAAEWAKLVPDIHNNGGGRIKTFYHATNTKACRLMQKQIFESKQRIGIIRVSKFGILGAGVYLAPTKAGAIKKTAGGSSKVSNPDCLITVKALLGTEKTLDAIEKTPESIQKELVHIKVYTPLFTKWVKENGWDSVTCKNTQAAYGMTNDPVLGGSETAVYHINQVFIVGFEFKKGGYAAHQMDEDNYYDDEYYDDEYYNDYLDALLYREAIKNLVGAQKEFKSARKQMLKDEMHRLYD